jgi:hypothetical protein
MYKKLTISVEPQVYRGLQKVIGPRKISAFLNQLAKPFVVKDALEAAYREMAEDKQREAEAGEWTENLTGSGAGDEPW